MLTTEIQFLKVFWVKLDGTRHSAMFETNKAQMMLNKHLLPQKESGKIKDAGIEIN